MGCDRRILDRRYRDSSGDPCPTGSDRKSRALNPRGAEGRGYSTCATPVQRRVADEFAERRELGASGHHERERPMFQRAARRRRVSAIHARTLARGSTGRRFQLQGWRFRSCPDRDPGEPLRLPSLTPAFGCERGPIAALTTKDHPISTGSRSSQNACEPAGLDAF
jgi:hypothetical protein